MDESAFITFRESHDAEFLRDYTDLLEKNAIPFVLSDTKPRFDVTFSNDTSRRLYQLKVHPDAIAAAKSLAEQLDLKTMQELPADYYLFAFSDDELKDVLLKADEWSAFDTLLAEKLLAERGIPIDKAQLRAGNSRVDLLDQSSGNDTLIVVFGYVLSVITIIPGLIIALVLLGAKKITNEGKTVPRFSENTRAHARNMILIFCIILSLFFVFTFSHI